MMTVSFVSYYFLYIPICTSHLAFSDIPSMALSSPYPIIEKNDYELKCDIHNVAPVQSLRVTWSSWNKTLHTQTFNDATVTPVNVSSTLNITADRKLHGENFTCTAELDLGPLEPEFLPPPQSLTMSLDVQCGSSPCAALLAFSVG